MSRDVDNIGNADNPLEVFQKHLKSQVSLQTANTQFFCLVIVQVFVIVNLCQVR